MHIKYSLSSSKHKLTLLICTLENVCSMKQIESFVHELMLYRSVIWHYIRILIRRVDTMRRPSNFKHFSLHSRSNIARHSAGDVTWNSIFSSYHNMWQDFILAIKNLPQPSSFIMIQNRQWNDQKLSTTLMDIPKVI